MALKRVWTRAGVTEAGDGWGVLLDDKPLRLPSGPALRVPQRSLAEAVAAEWQAAGAESGVMDYTDVPLTRLAGTAQLRIVPDPAPVAAAIAVYGETDLLCYRADRPPELVLRQDEAWRPWLEWARLELGAALTTTTGIIHVKQHPAAIAALRREVEAENGWVLAGLGIAVPALGSLVLGLALMRGLIDPGEAQALSCVDEDYQAELWGVDDQAAARRARILAELEEATQFTSLVR
jgi:chaperone required for assembly of F1-ATPase